LIRTTLCFTLVVLFAFTMSAQNQPAKHAAPPQAGSEASPDWVNISNGFARMLIDVTFKYHPEFGSQQGLAQFDTKASQPTLANEDAERKDDEAVVAKLKAAAAEKQLPEVAEDLQIMLRKMDLTFRRQDYERGHEVPFLNASQLVFGGLRILLDDQTPKERWPSSVTRLRDYAGLEPGYTAITEVLKQRTMEQMAKPGVIYPAKSEIETEMARNSNYIEGIAALMQKHNLEGWQEPLAKLKQQLADYDAWLRATVLPKARSDFRLPPERYALNMEDFGIDIPPDQLAAMAHQAFDEIQAQMKTIAAQVAKERKLPSSDYRDVIRELKKQQLVGDAILPFYENRLTQIEGIIKEHQIVTLPDRPAKIRIASAAETAQQPAPHMVPPPFLHNTGQRGEFVLPLNIPAAPGQKASLQYDDFTFDAAAWTLTAHEARPGHELQFDSMVEHGVSLARVRYAFNSTNAEGWGLYSEWLILPYMPLEGQLISLQMRLQRAARAFVDPELQSGKVTPKDAFHVLEDDVVLSHAMAEQEVERYTYRSPGQATSYFYGYTRLIQLRKETEKALAAKGVKFDQKKFHDFILAQGLLPPDLMRKAVLDDFIPAQK
jgi:uncharacterized protein (DUF885 family)